MDEDERTRICRLIETVITADGVVTEEERQFLRRIAQRFEISYDVAVGPVGPVSDPGHASQALRELPADKQARVMALLVESAVTDGEVHPNERALLLVAAAALSIDPTAVEERIQKRLAAMSQGSSS